MWTLYIFLVGGKCGAARRGPQARQQVLTHPFDAIPARRKREAAQEPEGVVKKSGTDKPLEKIKRNGVNKYKNAAGAKFGTVAHHNPALFEREAKKDKSGD